MKLAKEEKEMNQKCKKCQVLAQKLKDAKKQIETDKCVLELYQSQYYEIKGKRDKLRYFDTLKREYEQVVRELNQLKLKTKG